jgi:hypothetical protein
MSPFATYAEINEAIDNYYRGPNTAAAANSLGQKFLSIENKILNDPRCLLVQDNGFSLLHNLALMYLRVVEGLYKNVKDRRRISMSDNVLRLIQALANLCRLQDDMFNNLYLLFIREIVNKDGAEVLGNTGLQTVEEAFDLLDDDNIDSVAEQIVATGYGAALGVTNADGYTLLMDILIRRDFKQALVLLTGYYELCNVQQKNRWGENALSINKAFGDYEGANEVQELLDSRMSKTMLKAAQVLDLATVKGNHSRSRKTHLESVYKNEITSNCRGEDIQTMQEYSQQVWRNVRGWTPPEITEQFEALPRLRKQLSELPEPATSAVDIKRGVKIFDLIMQEDVDVTDYLAEDADNRLFVTDNGQHLFPFSLSSMRNAVNDGSALFYGCKEGNDLVGPYNVDKKLVLFKPRVMSSFAGGYIVADDIMKALKSNKRAFYVEPTGLHVPSVVSSSVMRHGVAIGATHCGSTDGGPILRLVPSEIRTVPSGTTLQRVSTPRSVASARRSVSPRVASARRSVSPRGKKVKIKKAECLPPRYQWTVGKGCFQLVSPERSSPRIASPARVASARVASARGKKVKIKKAECLPPRYQWTVGQGCFEGAAGPVAPLPLGRKVALRKAQCLPPDHIWKVGSGCFKTTR